MKTRPHASGFAVLLLCLSFAALAASISAQAQLPPTLHPTLHQTVMVGYQGWHRANGAQLTRPTPNGPFSSSNQPGDGSGDYWSHYANPANTPSLKAALAIDYLPAVSEMLNVYQTDLAPAGSPPVYVSSSYDASTVSTHFQWMQTYGIDGAFVQRFPANAVGAGQAEWDKVLIAEATAAEATGRSFAVMYDLTGYGSGNSAANIQNVIADWAHVQTLQVNGHALLNSPSYQYHNGKPVVGAFGIGFAPVGSYPALTDAQTLFTTWSSGGACIVAGVPNSWLRQTTTNTFPSEHTNIPPPPATPTTPTLLNVLALANIIMPWSPGGVTDIGRVRLRSEQYLIPDLAWCKANGLEYLPVVFPGFSNVNQSAKSGISASASADREAGRFLWEQYRVAADAGCTMVYQAMFDEMDEGTQIFKVVQTPPAGLNLLHYRAMQNGQEVMLYNQPLLPADYYLTLVGAAAALFHEQPIEQPFPSRIPTLSFPSAEDPGGAWATAVNSYLRNTDPQVYQTAANSYSTNKAIAYYMPLLVQWNANHTPIGPILTPVTIGTLPQGSGNPNNFGTSVTLSGTWPLRPISTSARNATIAWLLPVTASGGYELWIRTPGPGQNNGFATDALLNVQMPGDGVQNPSFSLIPVGAYVPSGGNITVNLQMNTQAWYKICGISITIPSAQTIATVQVTLSPSIANQPNAGNSNSLLTQPITFFEARLVPAPTTPLSQ